ncbi:MAG: polysaccharide biosynthesis tyrosine autokinase, partial [Flavobacteriaceae bacterium]|nr:polysaccharide biosynthesis tyrosine autokinase [Flavobacteriaceae bacterium]
MSNTLKSNKDSIRDKIEMYLAKWPLIVVSVFIALIIAFVYLRYAEYEYRATASIKIREDRESNKLPEISNLQNYGLFSNSFSKVEDEVKIIKSRRILEQVVKDLKLNIKFYVQGRIKEQERYSNPPLSLNFLEPDSVIHKVDTTLYVNIISDTKFNLSNKSSGDFFGVKDAPNNNVYDFGDRISTSFGDVIITPNTGVFGTEVGREIRIRMIPVDLLVESYINKIKVQSSETSRVLKLFVNENNKQKGVMVLNTLIEKYNEDAVLDKEAIVKVTSDFINNRLEIVSTELDQVDLTAESLKKSNRLSNIQSQANIFLQSEKENESKLINTSNQLQLIDYMNDYVTSNEAETDLLPINVGIDDPNVSQITKSYNDLVLQRDRILRNSSEKNPTVVNLNNQINDLKSSLTQNLNNLKRSTEITLGALNREDARIRSQIYSTPQKERQFRDISRQQSIKESLYLYLLEKREETAITLGMSSPNAKIIDSAYSTSFTVSPKRKVVYLSALILGLFFPIGILYLFDLMDTKVHNRKELENYVSAPFIGDIPKSSSDKKKRLVGKVDYSPKAEAFRMVRTNIDFILQSKTDGLAKTIFVTSTMAQEGKSHTAVNLAASLSYSEKKVLLIDTDIRIPKLDDYLGVKNKYGFTDYISDPKMDLKDAMVSPKNNKFLDVIPSGTIPPNPAELMLNERIGDLFDAMKKKYDYIVVDTAAVGLVTDTLLISKNADLFIYVVSAEKLDKRQLHVAQTMYEENRLTQMTILLNGTRKKDGYGYGYG